MQLGLPLFRLAVLLASFAYCIRATAQHERKAELVTFQSRGETLNGYLWVPKGDGPFRAVVWNYGHSLPLLKQGPPSRFAELASLYIHQNYVFFIPYRTGLVDKPQNGKAPKKREFSEGETDDIIGAISWLRQQSFVDASRVAVSGMMSGAVHSMLATERDTTIRAAVLFSPATQMWESNPDMQNLLERAIDSTPVQMFLIQPQNDTDLGPSEVLGRKLTRKGAANRAKIYPPFSPDPKSFGVGGAKVWGRDVLEFLNLAMK